MFSTSCGSGAGKEWKGCWCPCPTPSLETFLCGGQTPAVSISKSPRATGKGRGVGATMMAGDGSVWGVLGLETLSCINTEHRKKFRISSM